MSGPQIKVGFILMDQFSLVSFASANSVFNAFNHIVGEQGYLISIIGQHSEVCSDSGVGVSVSISLASCQPDDFDLILLCGGIPANYPGDQVYVEWLQGMSLVNRFVVGIGSGGYCLCKAGLLAQRKASVHWFGLKPLRKEFPNVHFSTDLFSIDQGVATCRGGTASIDLVLALVAQHQGNDYLEAISQYFVKERIGSSGQRSERMQLSSSLQKEQPKLAEAIELMDSNVEEPLSADDLAKHVGISRRQLERLFKKYLNTVPSRYYLHIRLEEARKSLRTGGDSMTDIALACGFTSAAHFSTAYRNLYGLTPTEERDMSS